VATLRGCACSATIFFNRAFSFCSAFELLGHFRLPAAVLLPPAVIRLFYDPNQLANLRNFLSFAKLHIRSTQLGDILVHTMTFLCHLKESFLGLRPDRILSLFLDQFQGGRSVFGALNVDNQSEFDINDGGDCGREFQNFGQFLGAGIPMRVAPITAHSNGCFAFCHVVPIDYDLKASNEVV